MGRRAHQPDPSQCRQVEGLAAYGIPEADIAEMLQIDPKTLRKHYRQELDFGSVKANAQVAGFLFNSAKNGNVTAQIFWLKTRARWKEVPPQITVIEPEPGKSTRMVVPSLRCYHPTNNNSWTYCYISFNDTSFDSAQYSRRCYRFVPV
jgi:hypothetical protein